MRLDNIINLRAQVATLKWQLQLTIIIRLVVASPMSVFRIRLLENLKRSLTLALQQNTE